MVIMKHVVLLVGLFFSFVTLKAQSGCTDPRAQNFNPSATTNDGSCTYAATSVSLSNSVPLAAPLLNESSGLIYTDGVLWTHNDSGNQPAIYKINPSTGAILQTVNVTNATNMDWEDITADAQYIYVGDFGNNGNGIRTDLRVYRISKSDITTATVVNVTAAIIQFSYSDQVIGVSPGSNNTQFDCEAFFVKNNVLHLFSKDWVNGHTKHYALSAVPGTYVISPIGTFLDVKGLVTSADISSDNQVVLVGYENGGLNVFMYLLYDFTGTDFFSGNKRRLNLGKVVDLVNSANNRGQVEAVAFTGNGNGYISSERFNHAPFDVPARLYSFSVSSLVSLPVDLVSFTASGHDDQVLLKWQTASEANSSFFSIERSSDARQFGEIGRQQAAGQSTAIRNYQYTDRKPVAGNNYYRLKQVDLDGAEKIYGIKTVHSSGNTHALQARYSESNGNRLLIETSGIDYNSTSFQVFNMNGVLLKSGKLHDTSQTVDLPHLVAGMYILSLSNGEAVKFQKR
jgi:hypothetical protein